MNIIVTKDNVKIAEQDLVHKGEYNVNPLIFSFSEEYEGISKMAVFSTPLKVYETAIVSNSCIIPHEVLTQKGVLKIGVYGYTLDNGVVNKRYSPTPIQIPINDGSYIKGASDPQAENPTEFEEFMQQLEDDIDSINDDINVLGQSVEDLQENKQDKIDSGNKLPSDLVSDENQTNKFVTAEDKTNWNNKSDFSGDYNDLTNKPTIPTKVSELTNDSNYQTYEDVEDMISALGSVFVLKGSVNTVADLPMQDNKLGDVYYVKSESAGYVWIEDEGIERWEELGSTIDTSDFLTKSELLQTTGQATNNAMSQAGVTNALNTKQNTIDNSNKLSADLVNDSNTTNKFVTSAEKTTWNNKSDFTGSYNDLTNKPDLTIYEEKTDAQAKYEELQAENEQLLAQIPTNEVSGTTINVQDSSNLPIKEFAMTGNATQRTFTLLDYIESTGTQYIDTGIAQDGFHFIGEMIFTDFSSLQIITGTYGLTQGGSGQDSKRYYLRVDSDGTINTQFGGTSGNNKIIGNTLSINTNYKVEAKLFNGSQQLKVNDTNYGEKTISSQTFPNTNIPLFCVKNMITNTFENFTKARLYNAKYYNNSGTLVRDYIPVLDSNGVACLYDKVSKTFFYNKGTGTFTAGSATGTTPTPDTPQDIHVVTGDNTVKVLGKNLFDKNNVVDNKRFGSDGQYYNDSAYCASEYITVKPNTKYCFNLLEASECICTYDKDKQFISRIMSGQATSKTTEANACYVRVAIIKTKKDIWQIELNPTATTYEPYTEQTQLLSLGNIELAKIGDYTDRIFKAVQGNSIYDSLDSTTKASLNSGSWYKQNNIYKMTLTDTFPIAPVKSSTTANDRFLYNIYQTSLPNTLANENSLCNRLVYNAGNTVPSWKNNDNGNQIIINFSTYGTTTIDQFKTWVSNNNLILYQPRVTPTYTEITDTTLIAQLENVLAMHTNKNVTNAWIEPSGDNAQGGMVLVYRQDLQTRLDNLETAILSL